MPMLAIPTNTPPVGATHEYRPRPHDGRWADADRSFRFGRRHDVRQPERLQPPQRGHIGPIVVGSLAVGLLTALALSAAPFIPSRMNVLTGVVLLGFAFGWALLACCPCGSAISRSVGRLRRPCSWLSPVSSLSCRPGRLYGMCSAGSGRPCSSGSSSGRFFRRTGNCTAEPGGGWSTRCSWCWPCPRSAAATKPYESRSTRPHTPRPASSSTSAGTGYT
jgi:hypothetical protein